MFNCYGPYHFTRREGFSHDEITIWAMHYPSSAIGQDVHYRDYVLAMRCVAQSGLSKQAEGCIKTRARLNTNREHIHTTINHSFLTRTNDSKIGSMLHSHLLGLPLVIIALNTSFLNMAKKPTLRHKRRSSACSSMCHGTGGRP